LTVTSLTPTSPTRQLRLLAHLELERLVQSTHLDLERLLALALLLLALALVIPLARLLQSQTAVVRQLLLSPQSSEVRNPDTYGKNIRGALTKPPFFYA